MSFTRKEFANAMDDLDEQIGELNAAKSAFIKEYKLQLEGEMHKDRAKAELTATRSAVAKRRKLRTDREAVLELDDLEDEILTEIIGTGLATCAPAHDADGVFPDDEITEQQSAPAARDLTSDLIPQGDSGQVATHAPEMANAKEQAETTHSDPQWSGAAARKDAEPLAPTNITPLRAPKPFRPNCLNRDKCGGQGPVECWSCTKAASERKEASA